MRRALPLTSLALLGLAAGAVTPIAPASAHHSFALFDVSKLVTLEGTVKKFDWTNPHSWITFEVVGPRNTAEEWLIELPSAGALAREGWNKNYLKVGEKLVIHVNPLKDGRKGGSLASFNATGHND